MTTLIEHRNFPNERDLYGARGLRLVDCTFEGEADGESALKEASDISLERCRMALRYPLWHCDGLCLKDVRMEPTCRAALWYTRNARIEDSALHGIKAVRECADIALRHCDVVSAEFGWKCSGLRLEDCSLEGEYPFLDSRGLAFENMRLKGKYSFQYAQDITIDHCELDTKDAFWHAKNVVVRDSTVRGEYLGWFSEGLTLERCRIAGTQPLCYARGLTLLDCTMEGCDLSFEYSDVHASVLGEILSVKNPRSGCIEADGYGEILLTPDSKYPPTAKILTRGRP